MPPEPPPNDGAPNDGDVQMGSANATESMKRTHSQQSDSSAPGDQPSKRLKKGASRRDVQKLKKKQKKEEKRNETQRVNPSDYHLDKKQVDTDWKLAIYNAVDYHVRALAIMPSEDAVPVRVSDQLRQQFRKRWGSVSDMLVTVQSAAQNNSDAVAMALPLLNILKERLPRRGRIANGIRGISDNDLLQMFRAVGMCGLKIWAPDYTNSGPKSMYNLLHRNIALKTFEAIVDKDGYCHLGLSTPLVQEHWAFVEQCYDNFVNSYFLRIARAEDKDTGAHTRTIERRKKTRRRAELAKKRVEYLEEFMYPDYMIDIARSVLAHSEDEEELPAPGLPQLPSSSSRPPNPSSSAVSGGQLPPAPHPQPRAGPSAQPVDLSPDQRRAQRKEERKKAKAKEAAKAAAKEADKRRKEQELLAFFTPPPPTTTPQVRYLVPRKKARNPKFKTVFRLIDSMRLQEGSVRFGPNRYVKQERVRVDAPPGHVSQHRDIPAPEEVTLDWYDPVWFNKRSPRKRKEILDSTADEHRRARIALPVIKYCQTQTQLEALREKYQSYDLFYDTYGKDVVEQYNVPTEEEFARVKQLNKATDSSDNDDSNLPDTDSEDSDSDAARKKKKVAARFARSRRNSQWKLSKGARRPAPAEGEQGGSSQQAAAGPSQHHHAAAPRRQQPGRPGHDNVAGWKGKGRADDADDGDRDTEEEEEEDTNAVDEEMKDLEAEDDDEYENNAEGEEEGRQGDFGGRHIIFRRGKEEDSEEVQMDLDAVNDGTAENVDPSPDRSQGMGDLHSRLRSASYISDSPLPPPPPRRGPPPPQTPRRHQQPSGRTSAGSPHSSHSSASSPPRHLNPAFDTALGDGLTAEQAPTDTSTAMVTSPTTLPSDLLLPLPPPTLSFEPEASSSVTAPSMLRFVHLPHPIVSSSIAARTPPTSAEQQRTLLAPPSRRPLDQGKPSLLPKRAKPYAQPTTPAGPSSSLSMRSAPLAKPPGQSASLQSVALSPDYPKDQRLWYRAYGLSKALPKGRTRYICRIPPDVRWEGLAENDSKIRLPNFDEPDAISAFEGAGAGFMLDATYKDRNRGYKRDKKKKVKKDGVPAVPVTPKKNTPHTSQIAANIREEIAVTRAEGEKGAEV
ncbi:hypothetical protein BD626DRAFT_245301 [Schizophyllum amplum]|uniref:Uncharacterized protein n=1 Tax=Schizophyllum amplum TaxID=97359 RepID=A0A550BVL0_9AGAR|nr:hypothetical protein BD626DRAFT_245301 [Auriculariopsis ampla]